jgi:hypothetical protein
MDLTGIENEAEFFPAGTLSDVLAVELADIATQWSKNLAGANPVDRISSVSEPVLTALRLLRNANDKTSRGEYHHQIVNMVAQALGYDVKAENKAIALDEGGFIPTIHQSFDSEGKCQLWIIAAPLVAAGEEEADPLGLIFDKEQTEDESDEVSQLAIEELISDGIFSLVDAPRYLLIASPAQWVLVDANKWPARSVLRFNLQDIFSRKDKDTYRLMASLIAKEARVPKSGKPLSDKLEEEAQRNANAVTTSLKRTVRDAIEILGQEVLDVTEGKFPKGEKRGVWIDGKTLSLECLRYMYRLLFILYAESNPRLRILDIKDPVYATGYSMEALRELESIRLRTPKERNGTYLWESLQHIFGFLYSGEPLTLKLPAVKVSLLDPNSTPLLNSVKLRNEAVQKVIRMLSLRRNKKSTGRISYAKLGIGQLGAVYETLISFTGTVCKEDMIELKGDTKDRAAVESDDIIELEDEDEKESRVDKVDLLAPTYFVPRRRIAEFNPEAVVFEGTQAKIYEKGVFTYRLAGRDREKTAAYYTPEPLARLLVKHLLIERCKDLSADELLELKILEPAMGSAAFLVETTNQLADLYLERKQKEFGKTIPQEDIMLEKQKVRSFIADRNCFGVDLNPTAVELGAISLWLNGLHKGEFSPWFGDQLHAGNSLIGARRAVYPSHRLKGRGSDLWFKHPPKEIGWKVERPEDSVYQWLLPAEDMAAFDKDKSIKEFAGNHQEKIKAWRAGGFFKSLDAHEISLVKRLTKVADELFENVAMELKNTRDLANDEIMLWPEKTMVGTKGINYQKKEALNRRLLGDDNAQNTLPFKRLKTAMDAWCALWLWPIEQAHKLPSRREFLEGMRILLEGGFSADGSVSVGDDKQLFEMGDLFASEAKEQSPNYQTSLFQETNVEAFIELHDWLKVAAGVAKNVKFVHYDLIFADVLKGRHGFDLIVGNPPWAKPNWNEGQILADLDPVYAGLSASDAKKIMGVALAKSKKTQEFLSEYSLKKGGMQVTSSKVMNPFAGGGANNLYRCFMDLAFRLTSPIGYSALIHQDGHLGEQSAGKLRRHWYGRISKHFEFSNKMTNKMFAEVHDELMFSLNVYRGIGGIIAFDQFTSAFLPSQINESYSDTVGQGEIPGKKNVNGNWDTRGHKQRVIHIDFAILKTIHALSEEDTTPVEEARFIQPFSPQTLNVFKQLAQFPKVGTTIVDKHHNPLWQMSLGWHESGEQKSGTIQRITNFRLVEEMVIQGPLFHVANPLYKTSRRINRNNSDYDVIDLTNIPQDYRLRTNYCPAVIKDEYRKRMTKCLWDDVKYHSDFYRVAVREMIALNGERSFISSLIPPKMMHVSTINSVAFKSELDTLNFLTLTNSLVIDAYYKATGRDHFQLEDGKRIFWVRLPDSAKIRALALNCITKDYAAFWNNVRPKLKKLSGWSGVNKVLMNQPDLLCPQAWNFLAPIKFAYHRRMALVEIDVIVAIILGISLIQLTELYRVYFPVLQENEAGTWYDQNGQIVWTCSKGLQGVGYLNERYRKPGRKEWEALLKTNPTELVCKAIDDTMPGGPHTVERRFVGPFFKCDRIEDYKLAWAHFEELDRKGEL